MLVVQEHLERVYDNIYVTHTHDEQVMGTIKTIAFFQSHEHILDPLDHSSANDVEATTLTDTCLYQLLRPSHYRHYLVAGVAKFGGHHEPAIVLYVACVW